MPEYDNTNSGALFTNVKKGEKHPDFKGSINVDGKEWDIAAWNRTSKAGKQFLSLKVSVPFVKETFKPDQDELVLEKPKYEGRKQDDSGDDIPF
jgi:uncharacterized protein (DUF736 family)